MSSVFGFPTLAGKIQIDNEIFTYDSVDADTNQLKELLRGGNGTVAASHLADASVFLEIPGNIEINSNEFVLLSGISINEVVSV